MKLTFEKDYISITGLDERICRANNREILRWFAGNFVFLTFEKNYIFVTGLDERIFCAGATV